MSPIEALLKATLFIDQNLAALCAEMVSFKELGVHENGMIGEATKIITSCKEIKNTDARSIVESAIALAAMKRCSATAKTIRVPEHTPFSDPSTKRDRGYFTDS